MLEKIRWIAFCTGLFTASFAGSAVAIELNTPYVPSLRPSTPAITGGLPRSYQPKAGSGKCYGVGCRDSGNYISREGIPIYKNGDPLEVRPSNRQPVTTLGPSSNHIQWCSNHYRSYRSSDNTYQPLAGPRTGCNSPFQ
ncbi:BA14K family protein [Brucella gallinifaecis]|uniref:Lectin-like protein BA14k n=1 Tax=Brucella gallinifaecis TaxID=215590 RepID=A0A502BR39_9HYPH|nr:BA14K family protein [Brucella gallinifaecis]TPF76674.1 BA14K family protein [Brucella gallinifaecis]